MKDPFACVDPSSLGTAIKDGDLVRCKFCSGSHAAESGREEGRKTNLLLFYHCPSSDRLQICGVTERLAFGAQLENKI